jgi:endonuclease III
MDKKQRAHIIQERLDGLYPETPIPLDHCNHYTLLVSVLLSAQCTDKMVNRVTPSLWKLADNPFDMAKKPVESIRKIIQPCGLSPQKSKAIKELSRILVDEHEGHVPDTFEDLEKLPGVGHKTASGFSNRHAHSSIGPAMGSDQRSIGGPDGKRSEEVVSRIELEQVAFADHFLWSRTLYRSRM